MMFSAIYVEEEVAQSERVAQILARAGDVPIIKCERYTEVFNRKAQNFRLQKQAPALILAKKHGNLILPTPAGYGFNDQASFYFSHMLNCVYDCRYCFLQGMYNSANYVLFVNYEDFTDALSSTLDDCNAPAVFYSGYDCDSLALEPVSRFCEYYLPFFSRHPAATLEIRTKSTQIRSLLEIEPLPNVVLAMSFTAHDASLRWEHKVPAIDKRIAALRKLQNAGWRIALRFEPLIAESSLIENYKTLFDEVFNALDGTTMHSVSTGVFRMPADFYKNIVKLYPDEPLFAKETESKQGLIAFSDSQEEAQLKAIQQLLLSHVSPEKYYHCAS